MLFFIHLPSCVSGVAPRIPKSVLIMPKVQTAASSNATSQSSAGPYYCFLQHWPLGFVEAPLGGVAGFCGIASVGYTAFSEKNTNMEINSQNVGNFKLLQPLPLTRLINNMHASKALNDNRVTDDEFEMTTITRTQGIYLLSGSLKKQRSNSLHSLTLLNPNL